MEKLLLLKKVYWLSWYRFIDTIEPFFSRFISIFSLFLSLKQGIWKEWVFLFCPIDSVVCSLFSVSVGGGPFITDCGSSASHLLWKPPRKRLGSMSLPVAFYFGSMYVHRISEITPLRSLYRVKTNAQKILFHIIFHYRFYWLIFISISNV